jgi:3-hydroxyisobutyrate dehydrogenase-like beta-hydroxyacid dehydrogenase|tara:strand:- start:290 stop:1150 length:861 start_codon:yes stop_codon:yes gene_type:complete
MMGAGLAGNLLKAGHHVTGYDIVPEHVEKFVAAGGTAADSCAAAAQGADFVCTVMPGPAELGAVVNGTQGIAGAMGAGALLLDFSTVAPTDSESVAAVLTPAGARLLETKMTGTPETAVTGQIDLFVGGEEGDLELARPLLEAVCERIHHCGPLGAGAAMKLVFNTLGFTMQMVNAEMLVLARKAGLDLDLVLDALRGTGMWTGILENVFPAKVFSRDFSPLFFVRLAQKDVRLATRMAAEIGAMTPFGNMTHQMFAMAAAAGYAEDNVTSHVKMWEGVAGVELKR